MRFYLAHSFHLRHFVRDEVSDFIQSLGIGTLNPFYKGDGTPTYEHIAKADRRNDSVGLTNGNKGFVNFVNTHSEVIVSSDLKLIDMSDGIIALMDEWTGGTTMEIFYTGHCGNKPVYLITNNMSIYAHPWIIHCCKHGQIFKSYDEFRKYMCDKYEET